MKSAVFSLLFAAAASATNIVTFESLDDVERTVYVTPSGSIQGHPPVTVPAHSSVDVELVDGFIGNAYAVAAGQPNTPGMLAEFCFQAWGGVTFFDVSGIVNINDVDNVRQIYPADEPSTPVSGCENFPCDNIYYAPDDIQTKSTPQTHLIVTLGQNNSPTSKRAVEDNSPNVARNFVIERY